MKKLLPTSLPCFLVLFVLIGVMQVDGLFAQGTTGTILGVVEDESQAVLLDVTVTATHLETNQSRIAITDGEGRYRLVQLSLGTYEVQAELSGFTTKVRRPITLTVGREAMVDFSLDLGGIEEKVVVTGEAPLVETASAITAGLVDEKKVQDLPLNGRDLAQLALLQEGVVTPTKILRVQAGAEGIPLSLGGTRIHQTSFLLDGTDIRGTSGRVPAGTSGTVAGLEAVKAFKVITGVYSAEYGRFTGGVITVVTKSGTNNLHGSLYAFHRNSALDARNFFDRDPQIAERSDVPEFKRNQFGFTLGGPIVRDKTFFFGSFEGMRQRLLQTQLTHVLSDEAREGRLLERGRPVPVDDRMKPYIDLIPRANGRDLGGGVGEYFSAESFPVNQSGFNVRMDHQFSDADSFFARYTLRQSDKQQIYSPQSDFLLEFRFQYLTLSEKHIFSPNLINEVRVGYTRVKVNVFAVETVNVDPSLRVSRQEPPLIAAWFSPLSPFGAFIALQKIPNNYSYSDHLSWIKGSHFLKMGVAFTRMQSNRTNSASAHGLYIFGNVASILKGEPVVLNIHKEPVSMIGVRQNVIGFYLQDDWKFSPRLTFNLGLRYEFITAPNEVGTGESVGRPDIEGRVANLVHVTDSEQHLGNPFFENPSLKNFSPRIGFAWDVFGSAKTSIRGGFGLFYEQLTPHLYSGAQVFNPPFTNRLTNRARFVPGTGRVFPPIGPNSDPFADASTVPVVWAMGNVKQPYIMQFSLNIQQEIMPSTVFTIGYHGSLGRKLPRMANDANLAIPVRYDASQYPEGPGPEFNGRTYFPFCEQYAADGSCFLEVGASRPGELGSLPVRNPNFNAIRIELWDGISSYNALKLGLVRRFSSGLQFQLAYHFSRAIDDSSNVGISDGNGGPQESSGWQVVDPDDKATMRGLSSYHVGQTFSANFTYDLPVNPQGSAGLLLGGWQFNGIVTAATGPASSFSLTADPARSQQQKDAQRPELAPGFSNNPILHDGREPDEYYDATHLILPTEGFFGNLGRNTLISPGLITFDFGVSKSFTLREETKLQFRAEFFNVFNRANFTQPNMTVWGGFGSNIVRNPTAGTITSTTTPSRQIQFALKIVF